MGSRSGIEWTTYVEKAADETVNNSSTLQSDDHLILPVDVNGVYFFELFFLYNSNATADFKCGWSVPSGTTMRWGRGHTANVGGFGGFQINAPTTTPPDLQNEGNTVALGGGAATDLMAMVGGFITTSSTAGSVTFQWAQNTADASDTKVLKGSFVRFRRTA